MRILELGSYVVPAYAGMILAEQGHEVFKWTAPYSSDPVESLVQGDELWRWLNAGKTMIRRHAKEVTKLRAGQIDVVIDNIRAETWESWGVDPDLQANRLGIPWVAMRDDFDGRSFDAVAQARAWGDHLGYLPVYLGDTSGGLWLAFKALSTVLRRQRGLFVLRQGACLAKLIEGEMVVETERDGCTSPWDAPDTYGTKDDQVRVLFKGEEITEPMRPQSWRWKNLRHDGGRYVI